MKIESFDDLLRAMGKTAFSGRALGEACDVLEAMVRDEDCLVVATFSGAMTVAKMGVVIVRMIETGMIDCIVSTGALMAHGLSEAVGLTHYKGGSSTACASAPSRCTGAASRAAPTPRA